MNSTDDETLGTISGIVGGGIIIIIIGGGTSLLVILLFKKTKSVGMYCRVQNLTQSDAM